MVEHLVANEDVAGSSPVSRTNFKKIKLEIKVICATISPCSLKGW